MAVLRDRATNVLDMIIEGFRNQDQPVQAGSPMQNLGVADVRLPSPLQRAMPQALGQMSMQAQPLPLDIGRSIYERRTPYVPTGTQMDTPVAPLRRQARDAAPRERVLPSVRRAERLGMPANTLIQGAQFPQGSGVAMTEQQLEMRDRQPFQMDADFLKRAEVAKKAVDAGADKSTDPTIIQSIQEVFGGRENMLRLAMAFNTMRLQPDAQLTAALSSQLESIEKNRVAQMSQGDIINYLQQNGYPQLAQVAAKNPKMAQTIMEQVLQKELKPAASAKPFSPIQDPDSGQMSIPVYDPATNTTKLVPIPGAITETPAEEAARQTEEAVRLKDLDEGLKAANSAFERANLYRNDINQLYKALAAAEDPNTQTGFLNQFLPAFTSSTAALREAGNRLGLGVVSSVTFGALSASELSLALKTGLDLTLPRPELIKEIERRIGAQEKLYEEMMKDAELLASGIGKKEFIKIVADRRKRNKEIADKLPELQKKRTISKGAWQQLNANQQLQLLEKNGIVVEFVQ